MKIAIIIGERKRIVGVLGRGEKLNSQVSRRPFGRRSQG